MITIRAARAARGVKQSMGDMMDTAGREKMDEAYRRIEWQGRYRRGERMDAEELAGPTLTVIMDGARYESAEQMVRVMQMAGGYATRTRIAFGEVTKLICWYGDNREMYEDVLHDLRAYVGLDKEGYYWREGL